MYAYIYGITCICFSRDGMLVATGSFDQVQ